MTLKKEPLKSFFPTGKPDAVLWDMDGVLSLTMPLHWEAMQRACTACGLEYTQEVAQLGIGRTDQNNLVFLLKANGISLADPAFPELLSALLKEKRLHFQGLVAEMGVQTTPGVQDWLEALQAQSIPCAVASSAEMAIIVKILERLGFTGYFRAILSGAALPQSKPHPAIFLNSAASLAVAPERCLVIEDAIHGIEAARRAGMCCLAIATSLPLEALQGADIVVNNLSQYPVEFAFS